MKHKLLPAITAVSLLANVALIGSSAGHFAHFFTVKHHLGPNHESPEQIFSDKITTIYEEKIKGQGMWSGANREEIKFVKDEVAAVLTAETFDPILYEQTVSKLHRTYGKLSKAKTDIIIEIAKELNQEERIMLAQKMHWERKKNWKNHRRAKGK